MASSANPDPPYPPLELMVRVGGVRGEADQRAAYERMGRQARDRILQVLPAGWSLRGKRVLDFGCGAGRTLRYLLPEAEECELWGCDIDGPSVEWVKRHLSPPITAFQNDEVPPLDCADESFDLIIALSVFTHLTEHWAAWMLDLHRVLRPGGLLIATFCGPERGSRVVDEHVAGEGFDPDRTGMSELAHGRSWDAGGPLVIHSPWWIRAHWGRPFEILTLEEKGFRPEWDQGFAVMRKRAVDLTVSDLEAPEPDEPRELAALRENVRQLGRQLSPFWARTSELRERQAQLRERIDQLRKVRERARRVDPPVFYVVGHPKSGTTWVMRLLDSHPEIVCRGEGRIFGHAYKRPDVMRMDAPTFQPSSLYRALDDADYLKAWIQRSVWTRADDADDHVRGLTRAAVRYFLGGALTNASQRIVGDKTPLLTDETIAEIAAIDPEARVIHVIRDGRDVAVSRMHHLWNRELDLGGGKDLRPEEAEIRDRYRSDPEGWRASGEGLFTERRIEEMAEHWSRITSHARQQASALGERYLEVRYERLIESPESEVRLLLRFLGAPADDAILERCVAEASFNRWSGGREPGTEDSSALPRKGIVGDWRETFTATDRRIFDQHAGDLLVELGYERDHVWARPD